MIQISIAGILKKPGFFPWWVFMTACSIAAALPPYALRIDCFMWMSKMALAYGSSPETMN